MRFLKGLLLLLLVVAGQFANPQSRDTTFRLNDTVNRTTLDKKRVVIERRNDSANATRIKEYVEKNGKSLDAFLAEIREQKESKQRQVYMRVAFGILFLIVVVVSLVRRRRGNR